MPVRFVQNSFVSGVLSPELHGRIDLKAYSQGAAEIENFIVRKTGGLRKRSGTELLAHVAAQGPADFRCVPFLYDRSTYAVLALWCLRPSSALHYRLIRVTSGMVEQSADGTTDLISVTADSLRALCIRQYGDTFLVTRSGMRAVRAVVNLNTLSVDWQQIPDGTNVATPPAITASTSGFGSTNDQKNAYVAGTRKYALWGVKGGILSQTPREKTVNITLAWKAGAKVTLSFTPDWTQADYYILGKHLGANYGEVATFYPSMGGGSILDATWREQGVAQTGELDAVRYECHGSSASLLGAGNYTTEDGRDSSALFVTADLCAEHKNKTAPILSLRIWFGGRVKRLAEGGDEEGGDEEGGDEQEPVVAVSNGIVAVTLLTSAGQVVDTWTTSGGYSGSEQTFAVANPVAGTDGLYTIRLAAQNGAPVLVRGIALDTSTGSCEYVDDNISPGSITGIQDRLHVGDGGMDCALSEIWEQRLVLAGSASAPFSLWFSQVGDLYNYYAHRPQVDSDAFNVAIPPTSASKLLHLVAGRWLLAFTESGEYIIDSATSGGMSFATCSIKRCSSVGAHPDIAPVATESEVLFVAADARSVYELRYDLAREGVAPVNRSLLAGDLTRKERIQGIAFARYPEPVLWCSLSDGTALTLTYLPEEEVFAWAHQSFGGGGLFLADVLCPGSIQEDDHGDLEPASDLVFVFRAQGRPESIWIERARGVPCGDEPYECRDHMGYGPVEWPGSADPAHDVEARVVTLRPESPDLNSMAQPKTVLDCAVRLVRSGKISVRPLLGGLADTPNRVRDGDALYTGDAKVLPRSYQNDGGQMVIASADANPCEILCVLFALQVGAIEEQGG